MHVHVCVYVYGRRVLVCAYAAVCIYKCAYMCVHMHCVCVCCSGSNQESTTTDLYHTSVIFVFGFILFFCYLEKQSNLILNSIFLPQFPKYFIYRRVSLPCPDYNTFKFNTSHKSPKITTNTKSHSTSSTAIRGPRFPG